MTKSQEARIEAACKSVLAELDDRGLLDGIDDDLFDEIAEAVSGVCVTAYLAGDVVVPVEPTPRMIEAGDEANPTDWNEGTHYGFISDVSNDVYRAMVSAATEMEQK